MSSIRFMYNNFLQNTMTYSSQLSTQFPATNAHNPARSRVWRPGGNFEVTSSNKKIYINDGTDKTITLTEGSYTYSTLASHIQTQLNASSSNWTCTYSTTTYKFTIDRSSGTEVLKQATTTDAAWDMLGYTLGTDGASAPFVADESRIHTSEWIKCYMAAGQQATFVAVMGAIDEVFSLSSEAVVKLQANTVDSWTAPPIDVTVPVERSTAAMKVLDASVLSSYNYYRVVITDRRNTAGPTGLKFGYIYVGDHLALTNTNIAGGFSKRIVDPSNLQTSENGALFFEQRPRYREYSSCEIQLLTGTEYDEIEQFLYDVGITTPFLVALDPDVEVSRYLVDMTHLMLMSRSPDLSHIIRDYYNLSFEMREAF